MPTSTLTVCFLRTKSRMFWKLHACGSNQNPVQKKFVLFWSWCPSIENYQYLLKTWSGLWNMTLYMYKNH